MITEVRRLHIVSWSHPNTFALGANSLMNVPEIMRPDPGDAHQQWSLGFYLEQDAFCGFGLYNIGLQRAILATSNGYLSMMPYGNMVAGNTMAFFWAPMNQTSGNRWSFNKDVTLREGYHLTAGPSGSSNWALGTVPRVAKSGGAPFNNQLWQLLPI